MAEDSGGLGGLLGWFGRPYDPQAAYEGLLSNQATQDALRARSLASVAQAFGAGAGSDARGSAIPFGATMGNAAAAAYGGQDELIKARLLAAQQQQALATAGLEQGKLKMLPELLKAYQNPALYGQGDTKPAPGTPLALTARQQAAGGGSVDADPNVRNFNFAGLRNPNEPAAGGPRENPKGWQTFLTPEAGVAAVDSQIQRYASGATTGKPINTLAGIIATWAPPTDNNDTAGLIARASKITGFKPDQPLDMSDPTTRAKVTEALIRGEHGDVLPSAVTPEVMAKVHGLPAPHTFAPPVAGVAADRPVTPTEADIYRKAPFPTLQNAGVVPPPVMTDKLPTGTIAPNPFNTPTGGPVAPPATPLAPQGAVGGEKLSGLLGTQPDPVTAQTMAALRGTAGAAPGVNAAASSPVASLLNAPPPVPAAPAGGDIMAALGAKGAPPAVPPPLRSLLAQDAGGGAPLPIPQGGVPQGPPPVVQGSVGTEKGGGLLNAPPPAPPSAAPPAGAVPPAAPAMPPGGIPLPALPPMPTLPAAPQMPNIPIPPVAAGTQQEQIAQNIAGISTLVGMPAPPWIQDLAKMPATRATELYKGYVTAATNQMNEQYKTQLQAATARYIEYEQSQGKLPADLTKTTEEQRLRLRNDMRKQGIIINDDGSSQIDPQYLELKGQEAAIERKKQEAIAEHAAGLRTGEKGQELILTDLINNRLPKANEAVLSLQGSAKTRALLDQGVITGTGDTAKLQFGKALQLLGYHANDDAIKNTEAFIAERAGETSRAVKAFGSGTSITNSDRDYAKAMVGGSTAYSEASIRRILDDSDKAHHITIENFNYDLARRAPSLVPTLTVQKPDVTAQTQGGAQLPAGVPEGSRPTGRTYQGKPVYDIPDGKGGFTPHTLD